MGDYGPTSTMQEPIAIVGATCRLAGEANSMNGLWEMMRNSRTGHEEVPPKRWDAKAWYHPDPDRKGALAATKGFFLKQDVASFDAPFFSVTPKEAAGMDPQKRLLLEVAYEALENAGMPIEKVAGSMTGVYVGCMTNDFEILSTPDIYDQPHMTAAGSSEAMTANRVSWFFDFRGPSLTLDTACSSSLYALHLACQSLRLGETDMNLVSGVNLMLHPRTSTQLTAMHMLSPDGTSHSFDNRANGYGRGEGIGCLIVKRLSDAVHDGDVIRAVIRGSAINVDGKTPSVTMPSSDAQASLIRLAYQQAGLPLCDTQYVELHGTGTPVGDPIELSAIASTFGANASKDRPVYVGSIKPSVGHTEGCAGLAGVFRAILSLEHGQILPTFGVETINPKLRFDDWNLALPRTLMPWPTQGLRRISVNSFGFGGANAHVILDDAYHFLKEHDIQAAHGTTAKTSSSHNEPNGKDHIVDGANGANGVAHNVNGNHHTSNGTNGTNGKNGINGTNGTSETTKGKRLLVYSAREQKSLERTIEAQKQFASSEVLKDQGLVDLAYTLAHKRSVFDHRSYAVASSWPELHEKLDQGPRKFKRGPSSKNGVVFVLTGQGAQWASMGKELLSTFPVFAASIERSAAQLHALGCSFNLLEEISIPINDTNINSPEYSQPVCTAVQVGLTDLLRDWGIVPKAVVGHSSGEIAAAYAAGIVSHEDAIKIAYFRGIYSLKVAQGPRRGAMMAAGISEEEAAQVLQQAGAEGRVVAACINSPKSVTLSGDSEVVAALEMTISDDGKFARRLKVSTAYHSAHMRDVADECLAAMESSGFSPPKQTDILMFSSVTGALIDPEEIVPSYWIRNMCQPVKFSQAMTSLLTYSAKPGRRSPFERSALVEVGPHSALKAPLTQIMEAVDAKLPREMPYTSVLVRKEDAVESALKAAGLLWANGIDASLAKVNREDDAHEKPKPIPHVLPSYSWNHEKSYWHETRAMQSERLRKLPRTDLLGVPVNNQNPFEPQWKNYLHVSENPWVEDHVITGTTLYPGAGMLIMAVEAAQQIAARDSPDGKIRGIEFRDVSFERGMVIPSEGAIETILSVKIPSRDAALYSFTVFSNEGTGPWIKHCFGEFDIVYETRGADTQDKDENDVLVGRNVSAFDWECRKQAFKAMSALPSREVDVSKLYSDLTDVGMEYGDTFQNLTTLYKPVDGNGCYGTVKVPDTAGVMPFGFEYPHIIHPATLDSIFHLMVATIQSGSSMAEAAVPYQLKSLYVSNKQPHNEGTLYHGYATRGDAPSSGQVTANLVVTDETWGEPKVIVDGLVMKQVTSGAGDLIDGGNDGEEEAVEKRSTRLCWKLDPEAVVLTAADGTDNTVEQVTGLHDWLELECHKTPNLSLLIVGNSLDTGLVAQLAEFLPGGDTHYRGISRLTVTEKTDTSLELWRTTLEAAAPLTKAHIHYETWDDDSGPVEGKVYDLIISSTSYWSAGKVTSLLVPRLSSRGRILALGEQPSDLTSPSGGDLVTCSLLLNSGLTLKIASKANTADLQGPSSTGVAIVLPSQSVNGASPLSTLAEKLETRLQKIGLTSQRFSIEDYRQESASKPKYIISLLDLASAGFVGAWSAEEFSAFKHLINNATNIFWVTSGGQMIQPSEDGLLTAPTAGLLRVLRNEMPFLALTHLDLSNASYTLAGCNGYEDLAELITNSWKTSVDGSVQDEEKEREFAEINGHLLIPRSIPEPVLDLERATALGIAPPIGQPLRTAIADGPIVLNAPIGHSPVWERQSDLALPALEPEHVEVIVTSASASLDAGSQVEELALLSAHSTGTIAQVGARVSNLAVGDRVIVLNTAPGLRSHVRQHSSWVHKLSGASASPVAAAAASLYLTAAYILEEVVRLRSGESLFVDNGIEPLSQALVRLALRRRVNVLTSATSQADQRWLIEECGVDKDSIVDPRGGDLSSYLLAKTGGLGVDVVITSSHAFASRKDTPSWTAEFGRTVVFCGNESATPSISFAPGGNGSLTLLDPASLWKEGRQSQKLNALLLRSPELLDMAVIEAEEMSKSPTTTILSISDLENVSALLLKPKQRAGILAITYDQDAVVPTVAPKPLPLQLDTNGTYILAGGLGSLGMRIALRMVQHGAKHIVLLSRSGSKNKDKYAGALTELSAAGCQVDVLRCDVTREQDVQAVFDSLAAAPPGRSIRGVVQCAMVLADSVFENMTYQQWQTAFEPKVAGTWYLHKLVPDPGGVDFFIMLSSIVSIIGNVSQANYAAGNAWMDGLAHYRRSLGLPANSLNVGLVLDSDHDINGASLQDGGYLERFGHMASVSTTLDELDIALLACMRESRRRDGGSGENAHASSLVIPPQFVYGMTDALPAKDQWTVDRKFLHRLESSLKNQEGEDEATNKGPSVAEELGAVGSVNDAINVVQECFVTMLGPSLGVQPTDISLDRPLFEVGVDSFKAVEIRNYVFRELKSELSVFEILSPKSLAQITALVASKSQLVPALLRQEIEVS